VRLADQIAEWPELHRDAGLILGKAARVLDYLRTRARIVWPQIAFLHHTSDEPQDLSLIRCRPRDRGVEVGADAEEFANSWVRGGQEVEKRTLADHDALDMERYGRRTQCADCRGVQPICRIVDRDLFRAQGAFQRLPRKGLCKQVAHLEDEVAAVGAME